MWNRRKTLTGSPDPTRAYSKQTLQRLAREKKTIEELAEFKRLEQAHQEEVEKIERANEEELANMKGSHIEPGKSK